LQTPQKVIAAAAAVGLALAAAGCGSHGARNGVKAAIAAHCAAGSRHALGSNRFAFAAVVRRPTRAYHAPGRKPFASFGRVNVNYVPTVFSVLGAVVTGSCDPRWYHVELPIKPNGATGWVRAADVDVQRVDTRIDVDLSARRVSLFRGGRLVLRATAAVGAPATPTPTGRYYVNQRLVPSDPTGPFGPGAIGISAFSNVLTGWTQGGPIAIHGTNEPWSIGKAVSNGCIRLPNPILRKVFRLALNGTPVLIRR
jgi:lipoprotein-anchoring transpeptidase ErfK/SrfK